MTLSLAFSPCPNDTFVFHALVHGLVPGAPPVEVTYADACPSGAFGVCNNAQVPNSPYRQDIHYYGVASDARFLQPFCESQSKGQWQAGK